MPICVSNELQENKSLLEERLTIKNAMPCFFAAIIASQIAFLQGISVGYSAILISQLKKPGSLLPINVDQASWIVSFVPIFRAVGALVVGVLADKYGRRTTMLIASLFISAAWLLTYFSHSIAMLYYSCIFQGFATGLTTCVVGLYISEISTPSDRGTLLSLIMPLTISGTFFVYVLGYFFTWETIALILCINSLLISGSIIIIPESHMWYMTKFRKIEAVKALMWFRNNKGRTVENEILKIEDRLRYEQNGIKYFDNFKDPAVWKPFLTIIMFSLFQKQAGYYVIVYYAIDFFSSFETKYDPNLLSIIFAAISFMSSLLLVTVMHKFERKTLLNVSGLGITLSMAVGAISLSVESLKSINAIPVGCVFSYVLFCMLGMIEIPLMMLGEIFPNRVRGTMSANIMAITYILIFITVKLYPSLNNTLGVAGLFWYFSAFSLLSLIYCHVFFPETRGKSLLQIEDEYRKQKCTLIPSSNISRVSRGKTPVFNFDPLSKRPHHPPPHFFNDIAYLEHLPT